MFVKKIESTHIHYFSLGIISKRGIAAAISSNKWQDFYLESQCFHFDPIVKCASVNDVLLDWRSIPLNTKKDSFIMETRKELTECSQGFSFIQKTTSEESAILAFGTRTSFSGLLEDYLSYKEEVLSLMEAFKYE